MQPSPLPYSTMRPQAPVTTSGTYDPNTESLLNADWYWGRITREEARNILAQKPDGSFLVRDALSKEGEYTLTLVKDGTEKLIKICQLNGKFGFNDCSFNSVVELIDYYKINSLAFYNKTLDITLSNPILRTYDEEDTQPIADLRLLVDEFLNMHTILEKQQQNLDEKLKIFKSIESELNESKLQQDVFQRADKLFQNQIKLLETTIASQPPAGTNDNNNSSSNNNNNNNAAAATAAARQQELNKLQSNAQMLRSLQSNLASEMGKQNDYVQRRKEGYKELERNINTAKPTLQTLLTQKDKFKIQLRSFGLTDDDIRQLTEIGFDAWQHQRFRNQPHNDESLWYIDCNRQQAEELLKDSPTGTFLIRARSVGHFALSIMCNAIIHHCIIYETESGFGFAAPYNIYSSLKTLVEHYQSNSLEEHNDTLTTTLRLPVLFWHQNKDEVLQDEYEFRQQQRQQEHQQHGDDETVDQQQQQQEQQSSSTLSTSLPVGALSNTTTNTTSLSSSLEHQQQQQQQQSVIVSGVATLMQNGLSSYDADLRNATASPPPDIVMSTTPGGSNNITTGFVANSATSGLSSSAASPPSNNPLTYPRYNSQHNP